MSSFFTKIFSLFSLGSTVTTTALIVNKSIPAISIEKLIEQGNSISSEQLTANSCKVLVNSIEQKYQILVCPEKASLVAFLLLDKDSQKLQRIEKFAKSIQSYETLNQKLTEVYRFQVLLKDRRHGSNTFNISKEEHEGLDQLEAVELSSCKLEDKHLSCWKKEINKGYSLKFQLNLANRQDFYISNKLAQ